MKQRQDGRSASRTPLALLARLLHAWHLLDVVRQTSPEVARRWRAAGTARDTLAAPPGLPAQGATLSKVRTQRAGVSALIDFGRMSWREQRSRTRGPSHKAPLARALQATQEACERHPCPGRLGPEVLAAWKGWAADHARAFQHASSAVEGRNGSLSPVQPTHRGVPKRSAPGWTVRHHFAGCAADGTPPASRFFRRECPDLCEHVFAQLAGVALASATPASYGGK
jgi:hypothetical protein